MSSLFKNRINPRYHVVARGIQFAWLGALARMRTRRMYSAYIKNFGTPSKLHFGCGARRVEGWVNVDITGSEIDIDLGCGSLPFQDKTLEAVCSQHVIEHLLLQEELIPLLRELHRSMKDGGEIWLSCPDIESVCKSYIENKCADLVEDREIRARAQGVPLKTWDYGTNHFINDLFHQGGQHKNIFDFDILNAALTSVGFSDFERSNEAGLLARFPEFPRRGDDAQSIYVRAFARHG